MSPAGRGPTPEPSRRRDDARIDRPTGPPIRRVLGDPTRNIAHLPTAYRSQVLELGDDDGLDDSVEREAERLYHHAENLTPGDTWDWAIKQANQRIRGAA